MRKRFFIYSLPRSGSAWLSQFLSWRGSFCYHEPLADGTWQDLAGRMDRRLESTVGAIDTSAYQRPEAVSQLVCRRFVLQRPLCDIKASLRLRGWALNMDEEIKRFNTVTDGLTPIYYTQLTELPYLKALWKNIVGEGFDPERAEYLTEMNVQREFAAVKRRVFHAAH